MNAAAARARRRDVTTVITPRARPAGIGIVTARTPSAAAKAVRNSCCVSAGGASLATLYARKPATGASSAATAAAATFPAYMHDRWFVPGPYAAPRGAARRG